MTASRDHKWLALDLVRALAAFTVLAAHVRGASWVEFGALPSGQQTAPVYAFFALTRLGQEAVMVFFVLSGLLVGGKLIERVRNGAFRLEDYAADRAVRIFLPLIPACIFTVAINWMVFGISPDIAQLCLNIVGLNGVLSPTLTNNGPLWSLAYEIWFYVLGGALAVAFSRGHVSAIAIAFLGVLVFSVLNASYLLFWAAGAVMVLVLSARRAGAMAIFGAACASCGVVLVQLAMASKSVEASAAVPLFVAEAVLCIGFSLCLPFLCRNATSSVLAPFGRAIRFASSISYTVYLVHYPVNAALGAVLPKARDVDAAAFGLFLTRLAICLLVALAFWWCFERNSGRLKLALRRRAGVAVNAEA